MEDLRRFVRSRPFLNRFVAPIHRAMMLLLARRETGTYIHLHPLESGHDKPRLDTKPRYVLDGCAFQEVHGGISRLWRRIMAEWSESGFAAQVVVLDRGGTAPRFPGFTYRDLPRLRGHDSTSDRRLMEHICRLENADLFISTWYTTPLGSPSLLIVHDMIPEVFSCDPDEPMARDKHRAITRASAFVCISQNTADDLHHFRPDVIDTPCHVMSPGIESNFGPANTDEIASLTEALGLRAGFFLFLGNRDNYKNADLLVRAAGIAPDLVADRGILFVGGDPELKREQALALDGIPTCVARLTDDELRAAYSAATALLFLSRYEGFGLPVTEAMACGCPVITGDSPSISAASDGASLIIDDDDPDALVDAMRKVTDPSVRSDLVAQGFARVSKMDWAASARKLAEVMQRTATETS